MAGTDHEQARSPVGHPAFLVGAMLSAVAEVLLPLQYVPVLFRHDREFIGLALAPLAIGAVVAARRRPRLAGRITSAATLALIAFTVAGYRLYGGIGWPDAVDLALIVLLVSAPAAAAGWLARRRRSVLAFATTASGALAAPIALAFLAAAQTSPGSTLHCSQRAGIDYCYFDGFEPFVDHWAAPVEGVVDRIPPARRAGLPPVRQSFDEPRHTALATPFLDWDRPSSGTAELALGLDAANWALGINQEFDGGAGARPRYCGTRSGDGRSIVAFWLAGQATREAEATLRRLRWFGDAISGSEYAEPVMGDLAAARDAVALLGRDDDAVAQLVRTHWELLSAPDVTTAKARELLGLAPRRAVVARPDESGACG